LSDSSRKQRSGRATPASPDRRRHGFRGAPANGRQAFAFVSFFALALRAAPAFALLLRGTKTTGAALTMNPDLPEPGAEETVDEPAIDSPEPAVEAAAEEPLAIDDATAGFEQGTPTAAGSLEREESPPDIRATAEGEMPEVMPYARSPLHPVTWKMDVIEAANNAAKVQAAARQPEIQEQAAESPEIETHPLLGADGGPPKTVDELMRAAHLWESAAVEAIGDPRFTPRPTDLPRSQLTKISRGPLWPDLWVEQHTYKPVLFSGEIDAWVRRGGLEVKSAAKSPDQTGVVSKGLHASVVPPPTEHGVSPAMGSPSQHSNQATASPSARPDSASQSSVTGEPSPSQTTGLPLAFVVGVRNREEIINRVIQAVAPRMASDVERITEEKLNDFRYELWAEERRTGAD
jgi:hypothetical protein